MVTRVCAKPLPLEQTTHQLESSSPVAPSLDQDIDDLALDVAVAQCVPQIQPDSLLDDGRRKMVTGAGDRLHEVALSACDQKRHGSCDNAADAHQDRHGRRQGGLGRDLANGPGRCQPSIEPRSAQLPISLFATSTCSAMAACASAAASAGSVSRNATCWTARA